jgi:hypothetical protein
MVDGRYSAKSAYNVQFIGAIKDEQWSSIWKAKVDNKCKFFMWLLLQTKLPTADPASSNTMARQTQYALYVILLLKNIYTW